MKPLGRRKIKFPGKTDCHPHPKRIWRNWWEFDDSNKAREKREVEKEIQDELEN